MERESHPSTLHTDESIGENKARQMVVADVRESTCQLHGVRAA